MIKNIAKITLFIGLLLPSVALADQNPQTWVTPSGAVVDWYGNLITPPPKVMSKSASPVFIAPMKNACAGNAILFKAMDKAHKDACMAWWLKQAPILPDGGSNMPQIWYNYNLSK